MVTADQDQIRGLHYCILQTHKPVWQTLSISLDSVDHNDEGRWAGYE